MPARRNVSPQPTEHTTSAKTSPQREEQKVVYVAAHSSIQLWPIILTLIKFNPGPFPFHFSTSCCIHTPKTRGQLWKGDQIQHNYGNGLPFSPSPPHRISLPPPLPPSLLPPSLSLSACESLSDSLKTCQMCSDQCNGLRVHYIHSAPFYEVTSWRGLPAGALCRTVNQAWQRWGCGEREEIGCDGGSTHLCADTNRTNMWIIKYKHTRLVIINLSPGPPNGVSGRLPCLTLSPYSEKARFLNPGLKGFVCGACSPVWVPSGLH